MRIAIVAACLLMAGCATAPSDDLTARSDDLDIFSGGRASGRDLAQRIETASRFPLGSRENPVRVFMPDGERAYLARLRCSDGAPPAFGRVGSFGAGVFGSIIDGYRVACANGEPKESMIFMDMYHGEHRESVAPPGFTIAPEPGARAPSA